MEIIVKGKTVLIDKESLPLFNSRKWHINDNGYVVWRGIENGSKKTIRLHREVIKAKDGEIVDHINRNKLDNRLCNLRITTQRENVHNSDRYDNAKFYYYDNKKNRWAIDSRRYGVRSVYVDSEKDAMEYVGQMKNGEKPIRKFTPRDMTGCKILPVNKVSDIKNELKWKGNRVSNASELANQYGVSYWTINRIAHDKYGKRGPSRHKKSMVRKVNDGESLAEGNN